MFFSKEDIAAILKDLRAKSGYTQKEVAQKIGRTPQLVGHWETGYSQPDIDTFVTLCKLYGSDMSTAFGMKKTQTENAEKPADNHADGLPDDVIRLAKLISQFPVSDYREIEMLGRLSPEELRKVLEYAELLIAARKA